MMVKLNLYLLHKIEHIFQIHLQFSFILGILIFPFPPRQKILVLHFPATCLWRRMSQTFAGLIIIIIIIMINPLTARVVGAPQMTLQPVFTIFPVLHCPLGLAELQACPLPDVVFPPLPLSALSSSPFHWALQDGFGQT